jgi:hypothetical protein
MGRVDKPLKTQRLTIVVTQEVHDALVALTDGGFAGKSKTETAEEMVRRGIEAVSSSNSLMARALANHRKRH